MCICFLKTACIYLKTKIVRCDIKKLFKVGFNNNEGIGFFAKLLKISSING